MTSNVLVIAAHPDDEALGCGATMAHHADLGDIVDLLFMCDGETARAGVELAQIERRRAAARTASATLGVRDVRFEDFPDNRLDTVPLIEVTRRIEAIIATTHPRIVYTHHGGDVNIDHRIVHQAVLTACRAQPGFSVREIYSFEVLSSTEWATPAFGPTFRPTRFVDVTAQMPRKRAALRCYADEMREFPHSRSYEGVEALARFRGVSAGLAAAEAFVVERIIA